jgi:hypothetical protein
MGSDATIADFKKKERITKMKEKIDTSVVFMVPEALRDWLNEYCDERMINRSKLLRSLLEKFKKEVAR